MQRRDGEYIWAIDAASPWFGVDGQFKGYIGSVLDISDRKQAEAALRQSEERYRTLFESIDEGFCVIEMLFDENEVEIDYRFVEVNPAFEKQSGLVEIVGKTILEVAPTHESFWFKIYGKVVKTGQAIRFEDYASALQRWFDVYAFRIGQPEDRRVAVLFQDISERKQIEQERENLLAREQAAREEAQTANRIKDEFLAVLSHELRSPLNPIQGWARLLQTGKLSAERQTEALATIERNARLQTQLIEDLLDISRIMQGKLSLTVASVSLPFVISAALETVRLSAEAKSIKIQPIFSLCNAIVQGDAGRLQQVVWNLLSNGVKFTSAGGQVEIELSQVGANAQIQVKDSGKGINPDFLPYVFEHFRQEDGATTRKFGGLGLGLAIVRQIVEMHGGTVKAESQGENQGATFIVQLPLMQQAAPLVPEPTIAPAESAAPLDNRQILLVDDEPDTREFQAFLLEQSGAKVTAVASGLEALQAMDKLMPDVIVSDIGMAQMDGYMLIQLLRARPPNRGGAIPAIALTAYAAEVDQQRAIGAGFGTFITKPVEAETLVKAIVSLLDDNQQ